MSILLSSTIEDATLDKTVLNHAVFLPMENVIQSYPWGSKSSLSELFNIANTNREPQAELWMGSHPNGCSMVGFNSEQRDLASVIDFNSSAMLGARVAAQSAGLPFLFKVLCAENALSIQVHPSKERAQLGFAEEEEKGIPLDAFNRNYKDPNHKPELVYALTPYTAMNGFRHIPEIIQLFERLDSKVLKPLVDDFAKMPNSQGLRNFFEQVLSLGGDVKDAAIQELLKFTVDNDSPLNTQIQALANQYPNDIGLFAPFILNVLTLEPGEAMYLDAETPHAYIQGTALEIMANSDNVLRAGLTNKYLDVEELVSCTKFIETSRDSILLNPLHDQGMLHYPVPVEDFRFSILMNPTELHVDVEGAEILFALEAPIYLEHHNGERCRIEKGRSVFIPAYTQKYEVSCCGRVARAYY
ncbi:mannose-6-phosphate isomerase [Vibrio maritimus]|uniref:mannose-6-phosphate isomerase n=1 Tax=Vibrio maritimus TaxID=990268 RepID=A0A090TE30_9VIBR|nr:mannose-6-phosphate isomerase [Vibrio maritimus]